MTAQLNEDIELAKKVISGEVEKGNCEFCYISGIYRGTTEYICKSSYQNALRNRIRILSVIASGDQIINSILLGSKDIECFDISRFPKYYLMLKIAAIKSLSWQQYLDFFFDGECSKSLKDRANMIFDSIIKKNSKLFNEKLYNKLYSNLPKEAQVFWNNLFDSFSPCEIVTSRLFILRSPDLSTKDRMCYNNPYLDIQNYRKVKKQLVDISIKYYQGNIFYLVSNDMSEFDLVNLSNIIECYDSDKLLQKFRQLIESIPLSSNGVVLSYLQVYGKFWKLTGRLDIFDENYQKVSFEDHLDSDGLLLYRKRKEK